MCDFIFDTGLRWRPPAGKRVEKELVDRYRAKFKTEANRISDPYEVLVIKGRDHVQSLYGDSENSLVGMGPYVLFLKAWFSYRGESEQDKDARLAMNYIRHEILSYEDAIEEAKANYYLSREFFDNLWKCSMLAIVHKFPHLEPVFQESWRAKRAYTNEDFFNYEDVFEEYKYLLYRQYEEEQEQLNKVREKEKRENQEEWKKWRKKRSEACRKLSPFFKELTECKVKHIGRYYNAEIVKVNPTKIRVVFTLKNGNKVEKDVFPCYLFEDNRSLFPQEDPEEYTIFKNTQKPDSSYLRWH